MIKKIEMTVDFIRLKGRSAKLIKDLTKSAFFERDFAGAMKKRINSSQNYRGDTLRPLAQSTLKIRRMKGVAGSKPLVETGKLVNTIKNVRRKNKVGVSMMKYGMHQAKGFVTNNHFAVKKGNKVLGFRDYSSGVTVPPRPFVHPEEPFAGLVDIKKKDVIKVVKGLKKALRHKVVYKSK